MSERVILVPKDKHERLQEYPNIEHARLALSSCPDSMAILYTEGEDPTVSNENGLFLVLAHRLMGRVLKHETPNAPPTQ